MNKLLITMGDPAGVGPEIIIKFYQDYHRDWHEYRFLPVVCGSKNVLEKYLKLFDSKIKVVEINESQYNIKTIDYYTIPLINIESNEEIIPGKVSFEAGKLSMQYLEKAVELVKNGSFDALVTAPISKDAINLAGYKYSGHTEFLAEKTGIENFGMVLKGNKITVVLNSTHVSLSDAVKLVKKESILKKIILADIAKREIGIKGKIAVAGLNPHNGENGLFGNEEEMEIAPAIEEAKSMGIDVEGPIVPDTLFVKMLKDEYNIAVVMYHDQGLIPMKMESFGRGVNVTVGLPIVRTSVDHGTAFDIAGKGEADFGSLTEALVLADSICNIRKGMV